VTITMNVSPGTPESAVADKLGEAIKTLDMPPGYTAEPFGRSREFAKLKGAFLFAIFLSFVFMYLVLAAQFESLVYPFIIMLALPLTFPFALLSLVLTGGSLNIFSMLGIIVLFGMVKKNAILQVDHANGLRRQGLPRTEAVLAASRDRLRPILMTTFAFVAGMIPLVTSQGIGSGFSKAMASVVVGGQTLSLLLTLIAIPVIYTWFDDLGRGWRWLIREGRYSDPPDRGASEIGIVDIYAASKTGGVEPTKRTSRPAIASLVLGVVAVLAVVARPLLFTGFLAFMLGRVGWVRGNKYGTPGKWLALVGMVLGAFSLLVNIALIVLTFTR